MSDNSVYKRELNKNLKLNTLGFTSYHPLVNILYYLIFIVFATICIHPASLLILLSGAIIYNTMISSLKQMNKGLKYGIWIGLMIMIINPLFNHRGRIVLFKLFNKAYTLEALIYGGLMALSLVSILAVFYSYQRIVNHHKFIYILGHILPKTALITVMTLRYIPLLLARRKEIEGIHSHHAIEQGLKSRVRRSISVMSILITWSLENALTTADSMKSRGYGLGKRTSYKDYRLDRQDLIMILVMILLLIAIVWFRVNHYLYLSVYPSLEYSLNLGDIIGNLMLLAFTYIPIMIDGKERLRWHYTE